MSTNPPKTLLTVPLEIRQSIYKELFKSATVRHGLETTDSTHASLLRVCHQIHDEAKEYFLPNITLHFRSTSVMLDCLTAMSPEIISKLRYMRVQAFPFYSPEESSTYCFSFLLPLFKGLQLNLLTVEDVYHPGDWFADVPSYYFAQGLLQSLGWKELHYIFPDTDFIASARDRRNERVAQPEGWNKNPEIVKKKVTVTMFIANEPNVAGMAEDPNTRSEYIGIPAHLLSNEPVNTLDRGITDEREVLVVARREEGAHVQDGSELDDGVKEMFSNKTWKEIKEDEEYINVESDPCAWL